MKKIISILLTVAMCFSIITVSFAAEMHFVDVQPDAWYYEDVKYAVENGLINGKTENLFAPASSLTGSEAIKLAACIHQLYVEGSVSLKSGFPWYKPYVDYCEENGIIAEDKNYPLDRPITRGDFVVIFANALPEEAYTQINDIEYGVIPDVPAESEYYEAAYKLYRAGILTGSGEEHSLRPEAMISRAEVAAIVTRMVDESRRIEFTFEKHEDETPKEENTKEENTEEENTEEENTEENTFVNVTITPSNTDDTQGNIVITDGSRNDNTNSSEDDDIIYGEVKTDNDEKTEVVVVTPVQSDEVVNGTVPFQGNTYVNIVALSIKTQPVSFKVTEVPVTATFTVEAVGGTGPYTYQWERQENIGNPWIKIPKPVVKRGVTNTANYSGSTTNTFKIAITKDNIEIIKYKFRCVITDADGNSVTSEVVTLTVDSESAGGKISIPTSGKTRY